MKILELGQTCCGCGACAARCPTRCIEMVADSLGFRYPFVDREACICCGGCDAVCPILNKPKNDSSLSVFWAKAKDVEVLSHSSSGGVFSLLATDMLARGGIVAGAAWLEGCRELHHIIIEDAANLDQVLRSKYVQSIVERDVYESIRAALKNDQPVLFCGTACQIAGMRGYLGKLEKSPLFLSAEVICHGVPSPELWKRWLNFCELREHKKIHTVNFRSKETGWSSYSVLYEYKAEENDVSHFSSNRFIEDWYMRAFLKNASLRSACLICSFKRRCGSDITLGDFWGIERQHPEVSSAGGVSAVVVNTDSGDYAFQHISGDLVTGESTFDKVVAGNPALVRPAAPHPKRDLFLQKLAAGASIPEMTTCWDFRPSVGERIISLLKRGMRRFMRR